jgi:hypothetical protein
MAVLQPKKPLSRAHQMWNAPYRSRYPIELSAEVTRLPAESYGDLEHRRMAYRLLHERRHYSLGLRRRLSVLRWALATEGQLHLGTLSTPPARFPQASKGVPGSAEAKSI